MGDNTIVDGMILQRSIRNFSNPQNSCGNWACANNVYQALFSPAPTRAWERGYRDVYSIGWRDIDLKHRVNNGCQKTLLSSWIQLYFIIIVSLLSDSCACIQILKWGHESCNFELACKKKRKRGRRRRTGGGGGRILRFVCNYHILRVRATPTYRVYRLYNTFESMHDGDHNSVVRMFV